MSFPFDILKLAYSSNSTFCIIYYNNALVNQHKSVFLIQSYIYLYYTDNVNSLHYNIHEIPNISILGQILSNVYIIPAYLKLYKYSEFKYHSYVDIFQIYIKIMSYLDKMDTNILNNCLSS